MAQLVKVESQMELKSLAEKVYDFLRRKSYLFPKISDCESGKETVEAIDEETKSITFSGLDGAAVILYKSLKAGFQFSSDGELCMAKAFLTYEKKNADFPDPDKYF